MLKKLITEEQVEKAKLKRTEQWQSTVKTPQSDVSYADDMDLLDSLYMMVQKRDIYTNQHIKNIIEGE